MRSCDGPVRCPLTGAWECPHGASEPEPGETWDDVCDRCHAAHSAAVDRQVDAGREAA